MDQIFFSSGVSGIFSPILVEKFWILLLFLILYYLNILLFLKNRSSWIGNLFCLVLIGNVWFEKKSIPFVRRNYFEILR